MSTLAENVAKVTAAHAALKEAIQAKGVTVPDGTKLSGMPALVEQIQTGVATEPTNPRAAFAGDDSTSIVVPKTLVVDVTATKNLHLTFYSCQVMSSLTLPDGFGGAATSMDACFDSCKSLQTLALPSGCGRNASILSYCFNGCTSLTDISFPDGFGRAATGMYAIFNNCKSLESISFPSGFGETLLNIVNGFNGCSALVSIEFPSGFGANCINFNGCFRGCSSLKNINGGIEAKVSVDLSPCTKLTHGSLMNVINSIQTVTTAQTLTLGTTNLAKLTDAEKKVATDKGWTLA